MYPWPGGLAPSPDKLVASPVHLTLKKRTTDKADYSNRTEVKGMDTLTGGPHS